MSEFSIIHYICNYTGYNIAGYELINESNVGDFYSKRNSLFMARISQKWM